MSSHINNLAFHRNQIAIVTSDKYIRDILVVPKIIERWVNLKWKSVISHIEIERWFRYKYIAQAKES